MGATAREAIAKACDFPNVKRVNRVIERYELMFAQHGWLRREHCRGRRLPVNQKELGWMMSLRPTKEIITYQKKVGRRRMRPAQRRDMQKSTKRKRYFPPENNEDDDD